MINCYFCNRELHYAGNDFYCSKCINPSSGLSNFYVRINYTDKTKIHAIEIYYSELNKYIKKYYNKPLILIDNDIGLCNCIEIYSDLDILSIDYKEMIKKLKIWMIFV